MTDAMVLTEAQRAAIERRGEVFVSAGAGTGKTRVLVERYLYGLVELGLGVEQIAAITYTNRAAGELADRVRRRIAELPRDDVRTRELERRLPSAWISTIHDLCGRLLRRHGMRIGIPPGYELLDEQTAGLLRAEACGTIRDRFLRGDATHVDLVLDYDRSLEEVAIAVLTASRRSGADVALEAARGASGFPVARQDAVEALEAIASDPDAAGDRREDARELAALLTLDADPRSYVHAVEDFPLSRSPAWKDPLARLQSAARAETAERVRGPLEEFVRLLGERYQLLKDRQSLLDFDDLLLRTRTLLAEHEDVRRAVVEQFREVMVDEFQDANALQTRIVDLISGRELTPLGLEPASVFFVGDEQQSIYRFQAADVEVFRDRRRRVAGNGEPIRLQENYRSAPGILGAVNRIFAGRFGQAYQALLPGLRTDGGGDGARVEVLAVETTARSSEDEPGRTVAQGRALEAAAVADRVAAAVEEGLAQRDVVILLTSSTDARLYADALRARGLTPLALLGRGFFGTDVVRDVQAYLALLRNGSDDLAFASVLASPLVGVSNDGLHAIHRAREAQRAREGQPRGAVSLLEIVRDRVGGLDAADTEALARFVRCHRELARVVHRVSMAELVRLVVRTHDYDVALLTREDGEQALANLEKLVELARGYERTHGPDLEGFGDAIATRGRDDREDLALTADESVDAVRLMTIHASKGLEFPFVVFADAGRAGQTANVPVIASLAGDVAFKIPGPGKLARTMAFEDLQAAEALASGEEAWRKVYVALTRAGRRLLISGTVTRKEDGWEGPLAEILGHLGVAEPRSGITEVVVDDGVIVVEGIPLDSALDPGPGAVPASGEEDGEPPAGPEDHGGEAAPPGVQGLLFDPEALGHQPDEELEEPPAVARLEAIGPRPRIRSLTVAAVEDLRRCPRQYEAKRLQGFRDFALPGAEARPAATAVGTRVHRLVERLASPSRADADVDALVEAEFAGERPELRRQAARWIRAWSASPLRSRLSGLDARVELELVAEIAGVAVSGRFDAFAREGGRALVVDVKTTRLEGRTADDVADDDYACQRAIYAIAALDSGVREVELAFAFLGDDDVAVATRTYHADDRPRLVEFLEPFVAGASAAVFPAHPRSPVTCTRCPAFRLVCPGAELL